MYQEPKQTIHDKKFSSLLLSKENLMESNSSLRFYYAVSAVAVPYLWESQPGTPKNTIASSTIPPLTPPPSFYSTSNKKIAMSTRSQKNKQIKLRKQGLSSSSSSSWLSSKYSQELEEEGGRRGGQYISMGVIKNVLLEIVTCAKYM